MPVVVALGGLIGGGAAGDDVDLDPAAAGLVEGGQRRGGVRRDGDVRPVRDDQPDGVGVGGDQRGFNSANLRGIGTSSTLVLLNGRRMAKAVCPECGTKLNRILGKA